MKRFRIRKMLSVMLAVVTVLSFWFSNVSFTSAEEENPPNYNKCIIWITDGWESGIAVSMAIDRWSDSESTYSVGTYSTLNTVELLGPDDHTYAFDLGNLNDEDKVRIKVDISGARGNEKFIFKRGFATMFTIWGEDIDRDDIYEKLGSDDPNNFEILNDNSSESGDPTNFEFSVKVGLLREKMTGENGTVNPANSPIFHFGMAYPNQGLEGIKDQTREYIYAYSGNVDYDGSGSTDEDDLRLALAADLYGKFIEVDAFGDFGLSRENPEDGIEKLSERINFDVNDPTVTAANGGERDVTTYTATINWGVTMEGKPVANENIPVYVLDNLDEILICTDYEPERGKGNTYFVRDAARDAVPFSNYSPSNGDSSDYDKGIAIVSDFDHVVIGANGSESTLTFESDSYITIEQTRGRRNRVSDYVENGIRLNCRVRIMGDDATYIAIHGEGESKNYDSMGFNGNETDTIYETGEDIVARVFVGETTLFINPLQAAGLGLGDDNTKITDVRLKDESVSAGVSIDKSDLNNIKVEFKSNFYDSVTLVVEYNDSITKEIVIERIGLVIHYLYLMDDGEGPKTGKIEYGCYGESEQIDFTYDFYAGEQIIVYATYYHPSDYTTAGGDNDLKLVVTYGDGTKKEISSMPGGHINGGSYGAVDTTTFFITYLPAKELLPDDNWGEMITHQNYMGGMNALVVNDGYDNDTRFGGAQMGNGSGVYWNGDVDWFE